MPKIRIRFSVSRDWHQLRRSNVLSDPARKQRYDAYGTFDEPQQNGYQQHHGGGHFDEFFYPFGGGRGKPSEFEKHRLTLRMYMNSVLERSYTQPYLIFAYSSYCPACFALESHWTEAVKDLEQFGYGIGTVNYMFDGNMFEKLRVNRVPSLLVLIEGRAIHYRGSYQHLSARSIRMFARDAIPNTFMHRLNTYNGLKRFLDQWEPTNKEGITDRLSTMGQQIDQNQLARFLERNKFLLLPRISSMQFFDDLCPVSSRSQRHFCLLLPIKGTSGDQAYVQAMRRFVKQHKDLLQRSNIQISYINVYNQHRFMDQFSQHLQWEEGAKRDILVLWRHEYVKARFAWIPSIWSTDKEIEHKTFESLKNYVLQMSRGEFRLEETAQIPTLVDEYQPSFFTRVSRQVVRMAMTLWFHAKSEDVLPIVSVVGTLLFILVIGYLLNYFIGEHKPPSFEAEKPPAYSSNEWHPEDPKVGVDSDNTKRPASANSVSHRRWREMESMIHELRAETYFGLIRLLKPGCRSIIVLVDEESKDTLLRQFARFVYPLRKNKTFSFGFLMVNKNLLWFRTLLEHTLPVDSEDPQAPSSQFAAKMFTRLKGINPKQTLGTVLVLCGYKLYFSMYHPMHVPSRTRNSSEDSDDSIEEQKPPKAKDLRIENVLNGFPNFLDRLLEVLSAGRGPLPSYEDGTKVFFHFEVLRPLVDVNAEGFPSDRSLYETIDDTRKKWPDGYGKPLELVFGKKFQLPVFETCICSMHQNEISQFDIEAQLMAPYPMVSKKLRDIARADADPKFNFQSSQHHHCAAMGPIETGYDILDDLIKNPTPLRVIFHLLDIQEPGQYRADSWQLNDTEKLTRVEKLREEGNEAYRQKDNRKAIEKYRESLALLDQLIMFEKPGDDEWKALDKKAEKDLESLQHFHKEMSNLVLQEREVIKQKRAEKEQTDKSVYKKMLNGS
ncbi:Transcription factor BTF3 [Aphelenchoides besseyi]|nr:Transcription factor BTF3 [Aphelenchoides besseyi]